MARRAENTQTATDRIASNNPSGAELAVQCRDMTDVRAEIDRVDRAIMRLIAERQNYIEQAAGIKQNRDTVRDENRVADVVAKVRAAAEAEGADPALAETVYRAMVEWCINYEFKVFDALGDKT